MCSGDMETSGHSILAWRGNTDEDVEEEEYLIRLFHVFIIRTLPGLNGNFSKD